MRLGLYSNTNYQCYKCSVTSTSAFTATCELKLHTHTHTQKKGTQKRFVCIQQHNARIEWCQIRCQAFLAASDYISLNRSCCCFCYSTVDLCAVTGNNCYFIILYNSWVIKCVSFTWSHTYIFTLTVWFSIICHSSACVCVCTRAHMCVHVCVCVCLLQDGIVDQTYVHMVILHDITVECKVVWPFADHIGFSLLMFFHQHTSHTLKNRHSILG